MANEPTTDRGRNSWAYLLLLIPFIATLWMPFYGAKDSGPALSGIPFFYWYMFLWVIISAVLTGIVYFLVN
jgi:hypothetical protein